MTRRTTGICRWRGIALAVLLLVSGPVAAQWGAQVENVTWITTANDTVANCQRIRDTLAALPTTPFQVVRLAPGTFSCGSTTLFVPSHVTLEGSGDSTVILGRTDSLVTGVVHLSGQATLSRLRVANTRLFPVNAAIAVSAWDFPAVLGSPRIVDVTAVVQSSMGPDYPLWVADEEVKVERGSFSGGDIRLSGGGYTFTLFGSALEGVDADATVTAKCYFYRSLTTNAAGGGGGCP